MAKFTGTVKEFKRYVGPRLRNLVQTWTRGHKASVGACENCGSGDNLESAHVKGSDRNQIIDRLLLPQQSGGTLTLDLTDFEARFRFEHEPLEKAFLVLCHTCHGEYDSDRTIPDTSRASGAERDIEKHARTGVLPIVLHPSPAPEFKRQLLARNRATIEVWYSDGRSEVRQWDASKFSDTSNVMGNLRSRPEFRQGSWQRAGMVKVVVKVQ